MPKLTVKTVEKDIGAAHVIVDAREKSTIDLLNRNISERIDEMDLQRQLIDQEDLIKEFQTRIKRLDQENNDLKHDISAMKTHVKNHLDLDIDSILIFIQSLKLEAHPSLKSTLLQLQKYGKKALIVEVISIIKLWQAGHK
jgi:hypothetical protein